MQGFPNISKTLRSKDLLVARIVLSSEEGDTLTWGANTYSPVEFISACDCPYLLFWHTPLEINIHTLCMEDLKHSTARPAVSLFTTTPAGLNVAYWIPLQREFPSFLNISGTYLTYFLTFFKQWRASPKQFFWIWYKN